MGLLDQEYKEQLLEEKIEDQLSNNNQGVRLTSLRKCNTRLNIRYTMSLTETSIKSYLYYSNNKCFMIINNASWRDMKNAIWFHSVVERAKSFNEIRKAYDMLENSKWAEARIWEKSNL